MASIQEIVDSAKKSLTEWGVQPNNGGQHVKFCNKIKNDTIKYFEEVGEVDCDVVRENLPEEIADAIHQVLLYEIEGNIDRFTLIKDRVSVKNRNGIPLSNLPPFYANRNQVNSSFVPYRRPDYAKCTAEELDPFNRFMETEYSKTEYFFRIWFDTPGLVDGNVFEAIVSCHAMHKEACHHCKCRGTIQWIGGGSTYELWGDMICCKCKAMYEIKSKKSLQKIDDCFNKYNVQSGSFRRYYWNHNAHKHLKVKKFLVIVSRDPTYVGKGMVWPVEIAEIDCVLPRLKNTAFTKTGTDIGTIIKVKTNTRKRWFNIPHYKELDVSKSAEKAFCHCFSREKYQDLNFRRANGWKICEEKNEGNDSPKIEDTTPSIEDVRIALESMKTDNDDDDWESNFCLE